MREKCAVSKYDPLWEAVRERGEQSFKLTFEEIQHIAGNPIDHSFVIYCVSTVFINGEKTAY